MPRTNINVTAINSTYGAITSIGTGTNSDVANKNQVLLTGKILLIAENTNAANVAIAINSVADSRFNRFGNITATLQTTERWAKWFSNPDGWAQNDGYLYFESAAADVKWTALKLPATD
jgi:hypothetical protein